MDASPTRPSLIWPAKLLYVGFVLALLSAGTLNALFKLVPDVPLYGVEYAFPKPELSLAAIRSERFQLDATTAFERGWGLRGYAVKSDSTLVVRLFGETRTHDPTIFRGDILVNFEDMGYVNSAADVEPVVAQAKLLARVQRKLNARGQVLLPLVIPCKATVYRDAITSEWKRGGTFGASDVRIYGRLIEELQNEHARVVDARRLLLDEAKSPEDLYPHHGRHWRPRAACRTFQAVIDAARPHIPALGAQQINCSLHRDPAPSIQAGEYDLYRLLNVWGSLPPDVGVDVLDAAPDPARKPVPLLAVGSSFFFVFMDLLRQQRLFDPALFYYYDETAVDPATGREKKVAPFTDEWQADTLTKPLIILGMLESFIPTEVVKFLGEVDRALGDDGSVVPVSIDETTRRNGRP